MNTSNDTQNHYPLSERNAEIEKLIMVYKTGILPEWKNFLSFLMKNMPLCLNRSDSVTKKPAMNENN